MIEFIEAARKADKYFNAHSARKGRLLAEGYVDGLEDAGALENGTANRLRAYILGKYQTRTMHLKS